MAASDEIWIRIERFAGEEFHLVSGKPFTYVVEGGAVIPSTTGRPIWITDFQAAREFMPAEGPGDLKGMAGASYLYAILSDPRITPS